MRTDYLTFGYFGETIVKVDQLLSRLHVYTQEWVMRSLRGKCKQVGYGALHTSGCGPFDLYHIAHANNQRRVATSCLYIAVRIKVWVMTHNPHMSLCNQYFSTNHFYYR